MSYNKEMVKLPFHLSSTPASYMKVEVKHAHFGTNERKWSASSSSCFNPDQRDRSIDWTGVCVGPRSSLKMMVKR